MVAFTLQTLRLALPVNHEIDAATTSLKQHASSEHFSPAVSNRRFCCFRPHETDANPLGLMNTR